VPVNSGLHTRKNFSEKYPPFGHASLEISTRSFLGRKKFKEYQFEGAPNY